MKILALDPGTLHWGYALLQCKKRSQSILEAGRYSPYDESLEDFTLNFQFHMWRDWIRGKAPYRIIIERFERRPFRMKGGADERINWQIGMICSIGYTIILERPVEWKRRFEKNSGPLSEVHRYAALHLAERFDGKAPRALKDALPHALDAACMALSGEVVDASALAREVAEALQYPPYLGE